MRRNKLGPQMEGNGFELWRKLFLEYEGSDELLRLAGRMELLEIPQIKTMKSINAQLDAWLHLF